MIWIKLCGMRSRADVAAAEAAGADAVGFVTAAGSVRRVTALEAAEYGEGCSVERFLVTTDETPEDLLLAARASRVTGVQPHGRHGSEAAAAAIEAGYRVLFPVPVSADIDTTAVPEGALPIFDGAVPGSGTGFDPALISTFPGRYVVAGGLTPDNVGDILTELRPYGVDVSSGIERERGVKDPVLMRRFVEAVR